MSVRMIAGFENVSVATAKSAMARWCPIPWSRSLRLNANSLPSGEKAVVPPRVNVPSQPGAAICTPVEVL